MRITSARAALERWCASPRRLLFCGRGVPPVVREHPLLRSRRAESRFSLFGTGDPFTTLEAAELTGADVLVLQGDACGPATAPDLETLLLEALQTVFSARAAGAATCGLILPASPTPADELLELMARGAGADVLAYSRRLCLTRPGVDPPFPGARIAARRIARTLRAFRAWAAAGPPSTRGLVIGGRSHPALARRVAEQLGADLQLEDRPVPLGDGLASASGRSVAIVQTTRCEPGRAAGHIYSGCAPFVELLSLGLAARRARARAIAVVMPYMLNARSDRRGPGHGAYASLIAHWIDALEPARLVLVEPHDTHVPEYFRTRVRVIGGAEILCREIVARTGREGALLVAPDPGAARRVLAISRELSLPMLVGNKLRLDHAAAAAIHTFEGGDVSGKRCIVIDDEIATGSTLVKTVEHLHGHGAAEVHIGVSHVNMPLDPDRRREVLQRLLGAGPSGRTHFHALDTQPIGEIAADLREYIHILEIAPAIAAAIAQEHT